LKTFSGTFLFLLFLSCSTSALPVRELKVGSAVFQTELALNPADREKGLMFRDALPESSAMLFIFPDEAQRVFWMKDTKIPLSIAYISKQGVIKEILDMQPYSLAAVPSLHSVSYALEVNQGAFVRQNVKVGDQIELSVLKGLSEAQ
jgi:uncharacterized membrane protein (UPF0127 family)